MAKRIFHIQAGSGSDNWTPTEPELEALKKQFTDAINSDDETAVIATRAEVAITCLFDSGEEEDYDDDLTDEDLEDIENSDDGDFETIEEENT